MKHRLSIQVGQDLVRVQKKKILNRLLHWLFGSSQEVMVLVPGKSVNEIEIREERSSNVKDETATGNSIRC